MKRFFLIAAMFCFLSISSWSQATGFEKLKDMEDVEYIHLDKTMLEAMFKASNSQADITDALEKAEDLTVITIDKGNRKAARKAHSLMKKKSAKKYSRIVSAKDEDDKVKVYCKDLEGGKKSFLVCHEDEDDMIIVIVKGMLSTEDAKDMIKIEIKHE